MTSTLQRGWDHTGAAAGPARIPLGSDPKRQPRFFDPPTWLLPRGSAFTEAMLEVRRTVVVARNVNTTSLSWPTTSRQAAKCCH
ncbi:MAG TPA: hypothetical protein VFG00_10800 [Acidothermaceae bacterium]|nr:hypothetical protein [Acidothermaceae bacterium]